MKSCSHRVLRAATVSGEHGDGDNFRRALARRGSEGKLPPGCETVMGDALDGSTYAAAVKGCSTFVHLVGVAHPSPAQSKQFREIDLVAARSAIQAAAQASIEHFVYLNAAHPAPIMKTYIEVRSQAEQMLRESGMNATILRPWRVFWDRAIADRMLLFPSTGCSR